MAEAALVMLVLAFLLFLTPVVWRVWAAHQRTGVEAHRRTFELACASFDHSQAPVASPLALVVPTPTIQPPPYPFYYLLAQGSFLGNKLGQTHLDFASTAGEGSGVQPVHYDVGIGGLELAGDIVVGRRAYVIRSPWTWSGYPLVLTQDGQGSESVQDWYEFAYKYTMEKLPGRITPISGLFLGDD